jgi:hypothetical protein
MDKHHQHRNTGKDVLLLLLLPSCLLCIILSLVAGLGKSPAVGPMSRCGALYNNLHHTKVNLARSALILPT